MALTVIRRSAIQTAIRRGSLLICRHSSSVNIIKSPFPDIEIEDATIPEFVFKHIQPYSKQVAFECGVTGRKYTYEDLKVKTTNLSRALRKKLKLQTNDYVAVMLPNVPEFPIVALGIMAAGLRLTTLNPIYTTDEVKRQLVDCGAKAIITLNELFPSVKKATEESPIPIITIKNQPDAAVPQGAINFSEFADNKIDAFEPLTVKSSDVAMMPYSSGTTGLPKGVLLSHRNIVANLQQFNSENFKIMLDSKDSQQDVVPAVLPLFHIYGFTAICVASLLFGTKVITIPKFTPELYLGTLKAHKPTLLMVVPPIVIFLNMHPAVTPELLQNVRVLMCGAAPLGALDEQKFLEKAKKPIHSIQGYGLTETSPVVIMRSVNRPLLPSSTGVVLPNTEIKIMPIDDPNATPLGPNELGELYVRGPQVMQGYHNRPEETQSTLLPDGWMRTGDLFYHDENQNLFVTDRIKELIKVKGFQVPPAELEEILRDYPGVAEAAVIGINDDQQGEVPRAYIVPKPNTKLDINKLDEFVNSKVAKFKRLQGGIVEVNEIPKNPSGKILRRQLKLQYEKTGI